MTTTLLIGLIGPAGSGKDATAEALKHWAGFKPIAFADPLRAEVCAAWAVHLRYLTERDTKELPIQSLAISRCLDGEFVRAMADKGLDLDAPRSPRVTMQLWGTEYRRGQAVNYWTSRARKRISITRGLGSHVCVTDVRFADEAALVRSLGGVLWRVERPGLDAIPTAGHASEAQGQTIQADRVIDNSGDLNDLSVEVMRALDEARGVVGVAA